MSSKTSRRRAAPEKTTAPEASIPAESLSEQRRYEQIAEAAYFLSQRRRAAGEHSDELSDWLEAERAITQHLRESHGGHVHDL